MRKQNIYICYHFVKYRHKKALPSYITTVRKGTNFKSNKNKRSIAVICLPCN
nr:MAG TPA: hypothetical protein [Caudoviricetes sp.]